MDLSVIRGIGVHRLNAQVCLMKANTHSPTTWLGENHPNFLDHFSSSAKGLSFSLNNFPVHVGIDLIIPRL